MSAATQAAPKSVWERLASPIDPSRIGWRQDGKPFASGNKFYARFVAYIDAQYVAEILNREVGGGDWTAKLEVLPNTIDGFGKTVINVKTTLNVSGIERDGIGSGKDFKQAETDSFKRAAVRFGIGAELYAFKKNVVQVDGDSKFAQPVDDPGVVYRRKYGGPLTNTNVLPPAVGENAEVIEPAKTQPYVQNDTRTSAPDEGDPNNPDCPKCEGPMWDNRVGKKNPKAPDFKCKNRACEGVIWPKKAAAAAPPPPPPQQERADYDDSDVDEFPGGTQDDDDLPF